MCYHDEEYWRSLLVGSDLGDSEPPPPPLHHHHLHRPRGGRKVGGQTRGEQNMERVFSFLATSNSALLIWTSELTIRGGYAMHGNDIVEFY